MGVQRTGGLLLFILLQHYMNITTLEFKISHQQLDIVIVITSLFPVYCRAGVTFVAVHDSYWTHACSVDLMNKVRKFGTWYVFVCITL